MPFAFPVFSNYYVLYSDHLFLFHNTCTLYINKIQKIKNNLDIIFHVFLQLKKLNKCKISEIASTNDKSHKCLKFILKATLLIVQVSCSSRL